MATRWLGLLLALLSSCTVYSGGQLPPGYSGLAPAGPPRYLYVAVLPVQVAEVQIRGFALPRPDTSATRHQRLSRRDQKMGYRLQKGLVHQLSHPPQRATPPTFRPQMAAATNQLIIRLQPAAETNLRLQQAGLSYQQLATQPVARLQAVLGTDAVLLTTTTIDRLPWGVLLALGAVLPKAAKLPASLVSTSLALRTATSDVPLWQTSFTSSANSLLLLPYSDLEDKLLLALPPTLPVSRP